MYSTEGGTLKLYHPWCNNNMLTASPMLLFTSITSLAVNHSPFLNIMESLSLTRFWCLFVSKKTTNNAVTPRSWIVLNVVVVVSTISMIWALWRHSIVWGLLGLRRQPNIKISWFKVHIGWGWDFPPPTCSPSRWMDWPGEWEPVVSVKENNSVFT